MFAPPALLRPPSPTPKKTLFSLLPDGSQAVPPPEATGTKTIRVAPSQWPEHRRATVFFEYPEVTGKRREAPSVVEPLGARALIFRTAWERNCVKNAFSLAGFARASEGTQVWTAAWCKHLTNDEFAGLLRHQRDGPGRPRLQTS